MKQIKGIYLPDSDTHFEYHLMQGPEFEGAGTYQYKKIKKALDVVNASEAHREKWCAVDVGAHVGLWSRILGHHFLHTYSFEPVPEMYECLLKNIERCPNAVHPSRRAITSAKGGVIVMNTVPDNTGNAHVRPILKGGIINDEHPVVPSSTLDDLFTGPINFLKLDVEGYELEVLRGADRILAEEKPIIVLEQKSGNAERYGWKQYDALNYLKQRGYEPVWEMSGDFCVKHSTTT